MVGVWVWVNVQMGAGGIGGSLVLRLSGGRSAALGMGYVVCMGCQLTEGGGESIGAWVWVLG